MNNMTDNERRRFLKFLGVATLSVSQFSMLSSLASCSSVPAVKDFGIGPTFEDDLVLSKGLSYKRLISFGDKINTTEVFGFNNDYIAIEPITPQELIMWVNHEYINPNVLGTEKRTKQIKQPHQQSGAQYMKQMD